MKRTGWIPTGVSAKEIKPFDVSLATTLTDLANGRRSLKFNNSVLVQKKYPLLYSIFILNLYIVYELNNWPNKSTNNFTLKIVYLIESNLQEMQTKVNLIIMIEE